MTAALLFLTPMSFLISVVRNSRDLVDRLALVFGLVIGPLLAYLNVDLDMLWAGIGGGTLAYFAPSPAREPAMSALTADLWPYRAARAGRLPAERNLALCSGFVAARGLDEDSEILVWVRAVATAVLAAVIAKLTIFFARACSPRYRSRSGSLAVASGFAGYFLIRRSVFAGRASSARSC